MSNFMNSFYSNLNDLTTINATDIQTESINTKALYINNTLFDPSGIDTSDYVTLSTAQSISNKTFTGTTIFSSIQLNDNLIVNSGGTTILNSNLALINFLSGTSTNINTRFTTNETNITALQSKTTGLSYNLSQTTTTCAGRFIFSSTPTCAQSLRIDASLLVGTGGNIIITNAQLQLIPNISTLKDKTQYLTFTTNNSTFSQTLNANNFNFTGNINNTFTKAQFDNAINFSKLATSDLQTQINSINTDLSNYVLTTALNTTLSNYVLTTALNTALSNYVLTTALNTTLSNYVLTTALNTALNDYVLTTALNTTLSNYVLTTALNTTLNDYALESEVQSILDNKIGTLIYFEPTDFTIVNNFLTNGELQYSPDGSTKINLIPIINTSADKLKNVTRNEEFDFLDINSNCHIYGKLQLGNYLDVEYSLNAVIIAQGVTATATALNTTAISTLIVTTIPAMNLVTAGIALDVANLEIDVAGLQQKTQKISYDVQDNLTTISANTSIFNLKVGNLESGLIQTENLNVRFIGVTEIRNDFIITNGFGTSIDGGINQIQSNQTNTFAGSLTVNNNFTSGGTNTNINSDNCSITGLTTIRLNTTNPILNVVLPSNVGAFNAQGILIGKEQTNGQARNCNIGYNYYQDGHANNYGYLGLNVMAGAVNLRESFRWFDGGCSIPVGNLTITEGNLSLQGGKITLTTGNIELTSGKLTLGTGNIELTSGNITSTNGGITLSNGSLTLTTGSMTATNGDVSLTNGDLNIVNGDATFTSGNITLGTGDIGITNGDLNILNGELKTNTINKYSGTTLDINSNGVGSSMNINAPQINIGYNQGIGALNTINIGSSSSISTIYLNGIVSSAFGFNLTGSVLQW